MAWAMVEGSAAVKAVVAPHQIAPRVSDRRGPQQVSQPTGGYLKDCVAKQKRAEDTAQPLVVQTIL